MRLYDPPQSNKPTPKKDSVSPTAPRSPIKEMPTETPVVSTPPSVSKLVSQLEKAAQVPTILTVGHSMGHSVGHSVGHDKPEEKHEAKPSLTPSPPPVATSDRLVPIVMIPGREDPLKGRESPSNELLQAQSPWLTFADDPNFRRRRHSRDGSESWDEDYDLDALSSPDGTFPREATTTTRTSNSQLRRRKRADSDASIETLERKGSSYALVKPGTPRPRDSFSSSPIMKLTTQLISRILRYLPFKQMFRARVVCKLWLKAFTNSELSSHIDLSSINKEIDDLAIFAIGKICGPKLVYISIRNCWNITDTGFQKFLGCSPNLKVVDMNSCWELTDQSVSDLGLCKGIQRLDLSNCRKVSDITLASTLKGTEDLKELKVSYCKNLTNTTMANIGKYASGISVLYLQRCTSISDLGFSFLRNAETPLAHLTVLSLSDCSFLTDETVLSISRGCPSLRALNLNFCCALTTASLDYLVEGCPKMISLDASFCGSMVDDEGLRRVSLGMPELERLSFRSCVLVTKEGLDFLIENCKNLRYVNPSSCKALTKEILATVPSHWRVLTGAVSLVEVEPSPHFPRTSADGKFTFGPSSG